MAGRPALEPGTTPGEVLALIRARGPLTRADIGALTGISRTAVNARIEQLLQHGLIAEQADGTSTGGRPPVRLAVAPDAGVVVAGALGASRTLVAVCDMAGAIRAEVELSVDLADGPDAVLGSAVKHFEQLLAESGHSEAELRGIGLSVPGAINNTTGRSLSPPIQPGWGDVPITSYFTDRFPVPIHVENDVNVLALAERRRHPDIDDILVIKASTGIGAGIVAHGQLVRGAFGAAGEIGHIAVSRGGGARCRCGNTDCLEAVASGRVLAARLRAQGLPVARTLDIANLARAGDPAATRAVREAGHHIGEVAAAVVTLLNPALVLVDGDLAYASEPLIAGMREEIYRRAAAMSTRNLRIEPSDLHAHGTATACASMILDEVLSPRAVDRLLAT